VHTVILTFDVGNTETVIGLFDRSHLAEHWRIATRTERTVDEMGLLVRGLVRESGFPLDEVRGAAVASVVPTVTPVVAETCQRHLAAAPVIISAASNLPVRLDVEEPLTVGADRIVNTLAAAELYQRDTIAVDLGTATTFDCITADGTFIGGIIAPGVRSGAEALVRRTAKLPHVNLERPDHVIGRRTETSLHSGIFFGAIATIDGIISRIKAEWQRPDALVIATGGLAAVLGPHCESVQRIEPFLTLHGLALAHRYLRTEP
jgi:type III pantothenate kinase